MAQNGLLLFLPLYLTDVLKVNPVVMGTAVMAMHLGGVIVSPPEGGRQAICAPPRQLITQILPVHVQAA